MKVLIICTGNTCRSQMAEGFLKHFDAALEVYSAGTHAELYVNPFAIEVMKEVGIDISQQIPKSVDLFLNEAFDYVITVCDQAKAACPYFAGKVDHRIHIGFEDPSTAKGSREEILTVYRKVRDEIQSALIEFYKDHLAGESKSGGALTEESIKQNVREKYGEIARHAPGAEKSSGCSCGCSDQSVFGIEYSVFNEDYTNLPGYNPDADLSLGCGIPIEFARISAGDTVVDLGSGAGNDCFVARSLTGETGKVIGLDFTPEMVEKARKNAAKLGLTNVTFELGDIDHMPIDSGIADVVVSNCVLNLVPDKVKAFAEIFRILKPGGHFCVSDIVLEGTLPESLRNDMVMYAGCVSGAIGKDEYLEIIRKAGFEQVQVKKDRPIEIPEEIFQKHISAEEAAHLKTSNTGIFSITVTAEKHGIVTMNNYNYND